MIISKNSLQAIGVCSPDKGMMNSLSCVCIEPDGSVIASNSKVWCWVSPLSREKSKLVPLLGGSVHERILLSADSVDKILKAIPKDTQYKGLLEHCDLEITEPGKPNVKVSITDGKQTHAISVFRLTWQFPEYKQLFANAWYNDNVKVHNLNHVCLNRKRLNNVCSVVDKVCSYDGQFAPLWWYFIPDGSILMRSVNELTDQRVWFLFGASDTDNIDWNLDECKLFAQKRKALKI